MKFQGVDYRIVACELDQLGSQHLWSIAAQYLHTGWGHIFLTICCFTQVVAPAVYGFTCDNGPLAFKPMVVVLSCVCCFLVFFQHCSPSMLWVEICVFALVDFFSAPTFNLENSCRFCSFHLKQNILHQRCHLKLQASRSSSLACILAKAWMRDSVWCWIRILDINQLVMMWIGKLFLQSFCDQQDTANQLGNGKFQKNLFQEVSAALRSLAPGRYAFIIGMQTPSFTPLGTLGYHEQVDMLTLMEQRAVVLLTIGITFEKNKEAGVVSITSSRQASWHFSWHLNIELVPSHEVVMNGCFSPSCKKNQPLEMELQKLANKPIVVIRFRSHVNSKRPKLFPASGMRLTFCSKMSRARYWMRSCRFLDKDWSKDWTWTCQNCSCWAKIWVLSA